MKALKIDVPGKPTLLVPLYDLVGLLMALVDYIDQDNPEFKVTTVEV